MPKKRPLDIGGTFMASNALRAIRAVALVVATALLTMEIPAARR
ncbi:hypothetical protein [Mesorhizobium sp. BR115XR7A]|nr:hypothetical protein [Mesorhizobium sp. BR115XR7A]